MKRERLAIAAYDFPRRVADDGVEARPREAAAVRIEEDFRKLELPVKQLSPAGNVASAVQVSGGDVIGQSAARRQDVIAQGVECRWRYPVRQPRRAPDVCNSLPARELR